MKGIYQFAANLLNCIPTKYYWNRSTSDLVIAKSKRVSFFLKHSVEWWCYRAEKASAIFSHLNTIHKCDRRTLADSKDRAYAYVINIAKNASSKKCKCLHAGHT